MKLCWIEKVEKAGDRRRKMKYRVRAIVVGRLRPLRVSALAYAACVAGSRPLLSKLPISTYPLLSRHPPRAAA